METNEEIYKKYLDSNKEEKYLNLILKSEETRNIINSQLRKFKDFKDLSEDLYQAANVGIFTGVLEFNNTKNVPLNAFLIQNVYYSILNTINSNRLLKSSQGTHQNIKLLRKLLENNSNIEEVRETFKKETGIIKESTIDNYFNYVLQGESAISLDDKIDDESNIDRLDSYSSNDLDPEEYFTRSALSETILSTFDELLTDLEKKYIRLFLGFDGQALSAADIARKYNKSRQYVSQVINKALDKLKNNQKLKIELKELNN